MISLLSVVGLLALASLLIQLDRAPWPLQRTEGIYASSEYWSAVCRDSQLYLQLHPEVSGSVRRQVLRNIERSSRQLRRLVG